jgi:spore maturation protein CgeB
MKLVIFGLTISSSWGNGHATLWRGLCRSLAMRGHTVIFFERDVPYYANARDLTELPDGGELVLYEEWDDVLPRAREHLKMADAGIVTSYCPDGIAASDLLLDSNAPLRVFYDLDAPVTLWRLSHGEEMPYVGPRGYRDFDLVLSYTGGRVLDELRARLGCRRVVPLYGSVDPAVHMCVAPQDRYRADLSYMGTWSEDRDESLRTLFIEPARRLPARKFLLGGAKYRDDFPWLPNIFFMNHLPPAEHPAFFCSSRITLNVTRRPMAEMGYCPSGRLFEAAACGVPVLSDYWEGLENFYTPGTEILVAQTTAEAIEIVTGSREELARIGSAARERTLECHTSDVRARELETILEGATRIAQEPEVTAACGA